MASLQIQGFINHFALSDKLSPTEIAAWTALAGKPDFPSTNPGTNKYSITAGSSTIDLWDFPDDVKSFDEGLTFDEVDRTSVNSTVKKYRRGRGDWEITAVLYDSYSADAGASSPKYKYSNDVIFSKVNATDDVRLLYVERTEGTKGLYALVSITEASTSTGEDSDLTKSVKFRLASGSQIPVWE